MTEEEWLSCSSPEPMLVFLRDKGEGERKLRLFAVACCREVWDLLHDPRCRRAVEFAEKLADGARVHLEQREAIEQAVVYAVRNLYDRQLERTTTPAALADPRVRAAFLARFAVSGLVGDIDQHIAAGQLRWIPPGRTADLLRCLFGNPFSQDSFDPLWRTSTVVALANGIYEERAFDRMGVLADALMDAGCEDQEVLNHCNGAGVHTRGCFVVDGVLGRR